jgi:hypothetical protein
MRSLAGRSDRDRLACAHGSHARIVARRRRLGSAVEIGAVAENDPQFAKSYADLGERTDDQLIHEHDQILGTRPIGVGYYLNEPARRTAQRQARTMVEQTTTMVKQTKSMVLLTWFSDRADALHAADPKE